MGFLFFLLHLAAASSATINTTPSTQHHRHKIINTTSSTQHHQHNIINTTPSTVHHQKQHHQHNITTIYTTSSTLHHLQYIIKNNMINTTSSTRQPQDVTPSTQHHQHIIIIIINTTSSSSSSSKQHHQHNTINTKVRGSPATIECCGRRLRLRGRRSTWSTSVSFCVAGAARGAHPERSAEVPRRLSTVGTGCVCVAGTALGAPQSHFGRSSTWSTSVSFCVAGAARGAPPERSAEVRRRLSIVGAGCFCVAGAALGASPSHFAWQVQHAEHLQRGPRKSGDD